MPDIKRPMPANQAENYEAEGSVVKQPKKKGGALKVILVIIIIAVILLIGLFLVSKYTSWNVLNVNKTSADATGWNAVFLSNGQVYFGKITKQEKDILVLTDIYYLQVTSQIQPADQAAQQQQQQNVSLVKLGNELHGPKDSMKINMAQILFTEELKSDSKVVDAVMRYKQENNTK